MDVPLYPRARGVPPPAPPVGGRGPTLPALTVSIDTPGTNLEAGPAAARAAHGTHPLPGALDQPSAGRAYSLTPPARQRLVCPLSVVRCPLQWLAPAFRPSRRPPQDLRLLDGRRP